LILITIDAQQLLTRLLFLALRSLNLSLSPILALLLFRDDELELFYSQGWWDVVVSELKKSSLVVVAPEYGKKHTVAPKALRPRWTFDLTKRGADPVSGGWTIRVGGRSCTLAEWREKVEAEAAAAVEAAEAEAAEARESAQPLTAEAEAEAAAAAVREEEAEAVEEAALNPEALDARVAHFRWGMAVEVRPFYILFLFYNWTPA
jgi:hypothetical protein